MSPRAKTALATGLILASLGSLAIGAERFPPPDFTGGHGIPETTVPGPELRAVGWLDVVLLALGLALASWISLKLRSRAALIVLSLAALAWFGFWRRGCVCAIGSIQNVALGVADPGYAVPGAVIAFFVLPLVAALIWGRGFCAGVCPHGAIQELVLVKPLKVPRWLDEILRVGPWIYLFLAILLAATGSLFIICKFDPFVGIFRMSGSRTMLLAGAGFLILSLFVGRPYCRYLCPYGALLGLAARVSKWRPTVTPDTCTQCRLCESSCPYGALNHANPAPAADEAIAGGRRRSVLMLLTLPVLALLFGCLGGQVGLATLPLHPDARLAAILVLEENGQLGKTVPDELAAFRQSRAPTQSVFAKAGAVEGRAFMLGRVLGALFGLILAMKLGRAFFPERSPDYETDRARCVSCTRCFSSCPYELVRRGIPVELPPKGGQLG